MMLELRDIYKTYLQGKLEVPVLGGISLTVEEGEYLAIMGPSGSGKTTLMNIIGCLDSATSGEYILEGEDIAGVSEKRMSEVRLHSIGFVFQSFYLLSRQSALDNVALPLLYAGVRRKERQAIARRALERVGLGDRTEFKPTQLSGGQCQRVAIARAIVNSPKILLADEPTGALDTRSGEQIMEIFQSLNDEGVTIVMITHEPEIAAHAKRTLHIRDGLLVNSSGKPIASKPAAGPAGAGPASSVASPAPAAASSAPTVSKAPAPAVDRTGEIVTPRVKAPRLPKLPKLPKPGKHKAPINAEEAPAAPAPSVPSQQAPQVSAPAAPKPPREEISGQTIIESLERQLEALNKKQDPSGPAKGEGPANE
ncbi:ABC transporter ATP-binding protein [Acutalibacter sp. 1XD8-36]|nr:ABC transporter ATP-binding protein [Acutalibacter sp. 1XD8-36]